MPQQDLDVQFGYQAVDGKINVRVASLVSDSITITLNTGESFVFSSLVGVGEDSGDGAKPRAGYAEGGQLTGLSLAFIQYTWTATQNGNSITGSFWTAPSETDDFCMYLKTCEENNGTFGAGFWPHIKAYAESAGSLPCVGVAHPDDHGYWDGSDVSAGAAYTFISAGPTGKGTAYDFGLGAFAGTGLYDGDSFSAYGQDEDRLWGRRNLSLYPSWGDHDTGINEMGWSTKPAVLNGSPTFDPKGGKEKFDASTAVWAQMMGPLQPSLITGAAANGDNSWMGGLGCLELIAPDGISKGSGDGEWPVIVAPTTIYGTTQIDNILTQVGLSDKTFKLMLMQYGIKYMKAGQTGGISALANNPLKDWRLNEYQQMFTATGNTPPSLMDNPKTNGQFGHLITLHGDVHVASAVMHESPAYTSNAGESWLSVSACAFNKTGSAISAELVEGATYDGSTVKYTDPDVSSDFYAVRLEVYGSKRNKELHIVFLESHNGVESVAYTEKLIAGRGGNESHAIDKNLDLGVSSIVGTET